MIIYPAIDLRNGQCVRLLYGNPDNQTTYSDDPASVAQQFAEMGAEWLHVVNLDGAFDDEAGAKKNIRAIQAIIDQIDIPIQLGGGIRSGEDIERCLDMGVSRVILGTLAVERPRQVLDIVARFGPDQIAVGIDADARVGKVATHGWQQVSEMDVIDFGQQMHSMGVIYAIHTDISRDGALVGANIEAGKRLGEETRLKVIISGGVASLEDVQRAKDAATSNIHGVIIGRALYNDDIDLREALEIART